METNTKQNTPDEMPLTPEEIKAIGEIQIGPAKHEVFLNNHYKKLIAGGIVVIIAATAGIAYYAYTEQQTEDAGALVVQAVGATVADSSMQPANYDPQALDSVITAYEGTASVETARLLKAMREMTDPANTDLSTMVQLATSAQNEIIRARANVALAVYFSKQGDDDKALQYWKAVADMPRNAYTALAYVCLCDLSWKKGDTQAAANYLSQAQSSYPESSFFSLNGQNDDMAVRLDLVESGVDAPKPNNDIFNTPTTGTETTTPAPATPAVDPLFQEPSPSTTPTVPTMDFTVPSTNPADMPTTGAPEIPGI